MRTCIPLLRTYLTIVRRSLQHHIRRQAPSESISPDRLGRQIQQGGGWR
ncbi:hypothetical protein QT971_15475 [Microcoleus sp. herbarium19]